MVDNPVVGLSHFSITCFEEAVEAPAMTTIKNFGHYWSRDLIDWGWQGSAGSMLGDLKPNANESDADFRNQIGIYVLYDENREAV